MLTEPIPTSEEFSNCCVAKEMTSSDRQALSLQALVRTEPNLAERHQVSRRFIYRQMALGERALEEAFNPKESDTEVLFWIPVTKSWLRQVVLALVLYCHSSFRGVIAFFRDILDEPISLGTIHNILNQTREQACQINASQELSQVREGANDELFQSGKPVLVGVDQHSLYCYLLAAEEHRDAETWAIHLLDLERQGLHPDRIIADGGKGLRAGQALAWPKVPCEADVFHGLREVKRLSSYLERQAYGALSRCVKVEQQMNRAKRKKKGNTLSTALVKARTEELIAVELASEVEILVDWLHNDVFYLAGPDHATRLELYDFEDKVFWKKTSKIVDELHQLISFKKGKIEPVWRSLVNQRDELLLFASRLDQQVEELARSVRCGIDVVRQMLSLQQQKPLTNAYWHRATALHSKLGERFFPLQEAVGDLVDGFHRTSSLVENFNSRLRPYFFLRRNIGPAYLDLLRFFLNHVPLMRSEKPERVGKSPAELLTGHALPHWLEMLGFTRFKKSGSLA